MQSGGGSFTVAPGELPLDSSFMDTRYAGSGNWQRPLGRLGIVDFGGGVSVEHDYTHLGFDTHVAHDFNDRNTTLSGGVAWSDDSVEPIGGVPVPFSALERSSGLAGRRRVNRSTCSTCSSVSRKCWAVRRSRN